MNDDAGYLPGDLLIDITGQTRAHTTRHNTTCNIDTLTHSHILDTQTQVFVLLTWIISNTSDIRLTIHALIKAPYLNLFDLYKSLGLVRST